MGYRLGQGLKMKFNIKRFINSIPVIGLLARKIHHKWINPRESFVGSENYWINRYDSGGNSGAGSYEVLADFKAKIINEFINSNDIKTIIEYGCGDGNQLKLAKYPHYTGYDISPKIISLCKQKFADDATKTFKMMNEYNGESSELTISLDVIYHLIEDDVFKDYINRLFDSSKKFVIVYSSNFYESVSMNDHVKHREFSKWVDINKPKWKLYSQVSNTYPYRGDIKQGSFADFFIYKKSL